MVAFGYIPGERLCRGVDSCPNACLETCISERILTHYGCSLDWAPRRAQVQRGRACPCWIILFPLQQDIQVNCGSYHVQGVLRQLVIWYVYWTLMTMSVGRVVGDWAGVLPANLICYEVLVRAVAPCRVHLIPASHALCILWLHKLLFGQTLWNGD